MSSNWLDPFGWWSSNQPVPPVVNTPPTQIPTPTNLIYRDTRPECITKLSDEQTADLQSFLTHYKNNVDQYTKVGQLSNIPAMVVGAIHWREASGDFNSYLENGDPLGSVTYANGDSNNGHSLPVGTSNTISFNNWDDSAVWSLNQNVEGMKMSGLSFSETDINDMLTFCEYYNGTGYKNMGVPSPYCLAGTSCYKSGKYISDGNYDSNAVDTQLGILVMLRSIIN